MCSLEVLGVVTYIVLWGGPGTSTEYLYGCYSRIRTYGLGIYFILGYLDSLGAGSYTAWFQGP